MYAKKSILTVSMISIFLIALMVLTTGMVSAADDPIFFKLDSETVGSVHQMEKVGGPGDNGQSGTVNAPSGGSVIWIADQAPTSDYSWPAGCWTLQLCTDSDWTDDLEMQIGNWDPVSETFTDFITYGVVSVSYNAGTNTITLQVECLSGDEVTPAGEYFALKLTNNDSVDHTVNTGGCSWLESPCGPPEYPVPELSTVILTAMGILGLGALVYLRRRRTSTGESV